MSDRPALTTDEVCREYGSGYQVLCAPVRCSCALDTAAPFPAAHGRTGMDQGHGGGGGLIHGRHRMGGNLEAWGRNESLSGKRASSFPVGEAGRCGSGSNAISGDRSTPPEPCVGRAQPVQVGPAAFHPGTQYRVPPSRRWGKTPAAGESNTSRRRRRRLSIGKVLWRTVRPGVFLGIPAVPSSAAGSPPSPVEASAGALN